MPVSQVRRFERPAKFGLPGERREQGLLDGVFGRRGVAQLQRGIAQQVGPQAFDLPAEIGGSGQGA